MLSIIRPVIALLLSFGLLITANGMFNTLLGLRSRLEGFTTETTGIIMAGSFLGMLIGAVYAIRIISAVGHIRAFAALASIMSVAVLSHVLWIDAVFWFVLRLMAGFCLSGMTMIVESWLNGNSENSNRGQIMAMYMITNYLGFGIGQFLILLDDPKNTELFIIASIILSLALVPILLTRSKAPPPQPAIRLSMPKLFKISPLGLIGVCAAGLMNAAVNGMGAVFGKEMGLELSDISTLMACFVLGAMVMQYPVGRLSDRFDRRAVIIVVAVATFGMSTIMVSFAENVGIALFAMAAVYGGIAYTVYPLSAAQLNDMADSSMRVQVAAGVMVAYGIGASIGPIAAGQIMGSFGPTGLFYYTATVAVTLTCFTALRMLVRVRTESNIERKSVFMPISGTSFGGKQLYNAALDSVMREKRKQSQGVESAGSDKMKQETSSS
ncbi:MFS transporter [Curvivirga aplysinae]|uniref:MFS transporter n=1 Tax=Curvivirga aplysinae TaxID=2529852 RepID=UPI0012BD33B1|nr:MFS transporter [Curvivirga aplysinae]MTI08611.1 MFS transporter [Curvivirga aplysinae]